jgi:hypothetical protein
MLAVEIFFVAAFVRGRMGIGCAATKLRDCCGLRLRGLSHGAILFLL